MSRNRKIALGIATIWPVIYAFIFFFVVMLTIVSPGKIKFIFPILFIVHSFVVVFQFALIIYYIINVCHCS